MHSFWSLFETKGTHEGHFITRHATPMCTKIDHKSSSEELCLILKCGSINKTPRWQKCEWKWMSGRTPRICFFEGGIRWISQLCIHDNDSVILRPSECQCIQIKMQANTKMQNEWQSAGSKWILCVLSRAQESKVENKWVKSVGN